MRGVFATFDVTWIAATTICDQTSRLRAVRLLGSNARTTRLSFT